ncbi:hypothetical protein DFJ73DRAFT_772167 [Zopfochytrium polystomum]|nr:hypothetical protein DFJ73DRAFT_772167 [Zopfochytrium polystomum]
MTSRTANSPPRRRTYDHDSHQLHQPRQFARVFLLAVAIVTVYVVSIDILELLVKDYIEYDEGNHNYQFHVEHHEHDHDVGENHDLYYDNENNLDILDYDKDNEHKREDHNQLLVEDNYLELENHDYLVYLKDDNYFDIIDHDEDDDVIDHNEDDDFVDHHEDDDIFNHHEDNIVIVINYV